MSPGWRKFLWFVVVPILVIGTLLYASHVWWLWTFGRSPSPVPSEILDLDKHFKQFPPGFPPDPGEAGKKTIQGIDADHDGVRDDVQRWIYALVPNEPQKQMALRQMARYIQEYDLADNFDHELIMRSMEPMDRAIQCMIKVFSDPMDDYAADNYLHAKILNTYSRVERLWSNNSKVTVTEMSRERPVYEAPCDNR